MRVIRLLVSIFNLMFNYYRCRKIKLALDKIYTYWISLNISEMGDKCTICKPIILKGGENIKIGKKTKIGKNSILTTWESLNNKPIIEIGNECNFGEYVHITAINKIIIGDGCLTGRWVTITDNSHGDTNKDSLKKRPLKRNLISKGPIIIGNNVWIGDKATILPNVTIGDGCIIGANSVVTKTLPNYSIVVGNPAKIIN